MIPIFFSFALSAALLIFIDPLADFIALHVWGGA